MAELFEDGSFPLVKLLSEPSLKELYSKGRTRSYALGETIHSQGDADYGLSIILDGTVELGMLDANGHYIVNAVYGAGQSYGEPGLFGHNFRPHSAVAVEATRICFVPSELIDLVLENNPEIATALLKVMIRRFAIAVERLDEQRRWPTDARLAKLLVSLSVDRKRNVNLKSNQNELAIMLGVSRVTVGLGLRTLSEKGLVETKYGHIVVCDVDKLDHWVNSRMD